MKLPASNRYLALSIASAFLFATGCAKQLKFNSLPLARAGTATVRVALTYDRNNTLEIKLSKVPDPSAIKDQFTRYVLWIATPDRQHVINIGQLRVDETNQARIITLTPLRKFILFITAEIAGDVMTPGPDVVFESKPIDW